MKRQIFNLFFMSSRQEILNRYKSNETELKKKKRSKKGNMIVIDDGDDWEREEDDDLLEVEETKEKKVVVGTWNIVKGTNENQQRSRSPSASPLHATHSGRQSNPVSNRHERNSPSPSPKRYSRRSPSLSPRRDLNPSTSSSLVHKQSPSRGRESRLRSISPPGRSRGRNARSPSPAKKMSDGTYAGLQTGAQLRSQLKERPDDTLHSLPEKVTVYRDKKGRKIDMAAEQAELLDQKNQRIQMEREQMEWGRGIVQAKERDQYSKNVRDQKDSSFSFYKDDKVYNDELKEKVRWGDTMAPLAKKRKKQKDTVYNGPPHPPNRFGILPGYRWDGVDRSNGWEVKLFQSKSLHQEKKREYHRWATEDM
jgi:pre-mRNA-splicing factor CWC26